MKLEKMQGVVNAAQLFSRVTPHREVSAHCVKSSRKRFKLNMKMILLFACVSASSSLPAVLFPKADGVGTQDTNIMRTL